MPRRPTDPLGEFKKLRNEVNIQMRNAKSKFLRDKINDCSRSNDPKKALTLINTLLGKNNKPNNLSELSVSDNLVSDPKSMAESLPMTILLILGRR